MDERSFSMLMHVKVQDVPATCTVISLDTHYLQKHKTADGQIGEGLDQLYLDGVRIGPRKHAAGHFELKDWKSLVVF